MSIKRLAERQRQVPQDLIHGLSRSAKHVGAK